MAELPLKTEFVLQLALAPSQLALYQMVGGFEFASVRIQNIDIGV